MGVLWKTVRGILNRCLMVAIQFHDTLHGLRKGRGTMNTSLEANLIQQPMAMSEEVLYDIFYIFIKDMTPLTVAAAWIFLHYKEWAPCQHASSVDTGTTLPWL